MALITKQLWIIVSLIILNLSVNVFAEESIVDLSSLRSGQEITERLLYLEDQRGSLSFEQVLSQEWSKMDSENLTFGYTNSVFWFQVAFTNNTSTDIERLLAVDYPVLDYIDIYRSNGDGSWQHQELGDKYPFYKREVEHRNFIIPLTVSANSTNHYVFRVKTSSSVQFPLAVWEERHFFEDDQVHLLMMGIYYGIMLVMSIYSFFVFISTREMNYLYYMSCVACMALFLASYQGFSFQYLWPEATEWNDRSIAFFLGGALLFGVLFTRLFLQVNTIAFINISLLLLSFPVVLVLLLSKFISYHIQIQIIIAITVVLLFSAIFVGIMRWIQGYVTARYYTIAWVAAMLGGIVLAFNKFNIIERSFLTEYSVQFGSGIEVILLSFALADRLNREKRKRYMAQIVALDNERLAREAQQQAYHAQKEANELLEKRVHERTLELERVNKKLEIMSITDALTGVHNRRYFDNALKLEVARAQRDIEEVSILIVDIDYFKKINDTYGHQVGDEVLKAVAQKMSGLAGRSADLLARFGGEEFVIILPKTDVDGALVVAQSICISVAEMSFSEISDDLSVTVSIGVFGAIPTATSDHEEWIRKADKALYDAKESGRNKVLAYQDNH